MKTTHHKLHTSESLFYINLHLKRSKPMFQNSLIIIHKTLKRKEKKKTKLRSGLFDLPIKCT